MIEFVSGIDWSLNPNFTQDVAVLSGPIYAITNVLKAIFGIRFGRVLLVVLGISILIGMLVLIAAFEPLRNFIYAVMLAFLGALGIHDSEELDKKMSRMQEEAEHVSDGPTSSYATGTGTTETSTSTSPGGGSSTDYEPD